MRMRVEVLLNYSIALAFITISTQHTPCQLRKYEQGFVCVCNESYCDTLKMSLPEAKGQYLFVSSTDLGRRFDSFIGNISFSHDCKIVENFVDEGFPTKATIRVNRNKKYQKIVGFGGAFTGSVSHLLNLLPESIRHTIYRDYYSQSGMGYNFMRIPIGGCDFDLEPWAYNEAPIDDVKLTNFTQLDQRDVQKLKQIKELKKVADNNDIMIMGAAWSSPPWMKTNNEWAGESKLKPEYFQTWAQYHLQYLRLMAAENLSYWAISTGNEPLNSAYVSFMSLGWSAEDQGKWVSNHLGPLLNQSEFHYVKIFACDDQRTAFPWWFNRMDLGGKNAMSYVSGLAVHWYLDQTTPPDLLNHTHDKYPDKIILNTESCSGSNLNEIHVPQLGLWDRAERYALSIIEDLQHWVGGWIDWNLILDEEGGPNYVQNFVDAPIIVNLTSKNEFYKQPIFYVLAHFSKFLPPGSVRIDVQLDNISASVRVVAFQRPDNFTAVILYNKSMQVHNVTLIDDEEGYLELTLEPRSINSVLIS